MRSLLTTGFLTIACLVNSAAAEVLNFTIDGSQSFFSVAVTSRDGVTTYSSPQTPGSDTTGAFGNLAVDVTAGSLQFLSTNQTFLANQLAPQAPLADGSPGTSPAAIGLALNFPDVGGGVIAGRNYVADATSPAIPVVGNTFDSTQVIFGLADAEVAYNLTVLGSPVVGTFGGPGTAPNEAIGGTLDLVGSTYTLSVPYSVRAFILVSGVETTILYTGRTVATATVPEPSALALATICAAAFAGYSVRRRK